jgi:PAS domain S-box-containing protein
MSATITMSMTMSTLMMLGRLTLPYTMSLAYLPMILVIGYEMSQDSLRALQLSRKLSETQKRMNLAAIAADLGMWEWDLAKDEFWATDISRARIGAADAERITLNQFLKSIHPDDREPTLRAATQAIDSGSQFQVEYRRVSPESPISWFSAKGEVVHGPKGKPLFVRGVSMDITALKQAEDALKESEARLKEAQRIAHIGNWELDLVTDTLTWSDEIFRIFEIDPQHFGASYASFLAAVHPEDRYMVDNIYAQSLKNGHPYAVTHRLLMPDGRTKYVHEQGKTLYSPEGTPLRSIGTVQDITELKKTESERIQLRNELSHLNRAMTMSELSASLAHEINQPLGAILNNASAARVLNARLEEEGAEVGEILADIIADATRAGEIIHKIRGIMSKEEAKFEQLDMNALIKKVIDLYRNILNIEKTSVSLDLQPELSPVRGDRIQLQQVLMNFLSNATEAMRPSSTRRLSILSTTQSPDTIAVSVSDSGPGVDEDRKDKIFQPFFTTKKEGLGMGLRLCQSIIEEHGGRIWAENNPAGGATFSFSLKAYQGDSE